MGRKQHGAAAVAKRGLQRRELLEGGVGPRAFIGADDEGRALLLRDLEHRFA